MASPSPMPAAANDDEIQDQPLPGGFNARFGAAANDMPAAANDDSMQDQPLPGDLNARFGAAANDPTPLAANEPMAPAAAVNDEAYVVRPTLAVDNTAPAPQVPEPEAPAPAQAYPSVVSIPTFAPAAPAPSAAAPEEDEPEAEGPKLATPEAEAPEALQQEVPEPEEAAPATAAPEAAGPEGADPAAPVAAPAAASSLMPGAAAMKRTLPGGLSKLTGTERQNITAQLSRGQFNADEDIANRMSAIDLHQKKHEELGKSIQGMAEGPGRDTALKQFSQSSKGLSELVKDVGERATMYSNDPNSNFKMDKEDIADYVSEKGEKIQETIGDVSSHLEQENGGNKAQKQAQEQKEEMNRIAEMLKKMMEMLKNMFSPKNSASAPKPNGIP